MASNSNTTSGANWREMIRLSLMRSGTLIGAIALGLFSVIYTVSLLSYASEDNAFNSAASDAPHNLLGSMGAYIADGALLVFGLPAILILPLMIIFTRRMWQNKSQPYWRRQIFMTLTGMLLIGFAMAFWQQDNKVSLPAGWGGVISLLLSKLGGEAVALVSGGWQMFVRVILLAGALIIGLLTLVSALRIEDRVFNVPTIKRPKLGISFARKAAINGEDALDDVGLNDAGLDGKGRIITPKVADPAPRKQVVADMRPAPVIAEPTQKPKKASFSTGARQGDFLSNYTLPSIDLLDPPAQKNAPKLDKAALERNARLLETVLDDFSVKGEITAVRPGPVVTMYELEPAPGIKSSRVIQLAEDIARNMSALSARVSVIPGRTVMGIELPNADREMVSLSEMVESDDFAGQDGQLAIILGKNISGDPVIADLAPMPHLLVAGTTGSGKSVGLNCMILSLLYRMTPDQCRLIMIDPKMLELSSYDDIPHLLSPVVTEPAKAIRALKWAVEQMEERYRMMSSLSVRNLANFNEKIRSAKAKGQPLGRKVQIGYDQISGQPQYEEESLDYEVMPQIVIVVDELADLMMTAGKEVEFLIQRLAQKARAAGIHLIMATQRPSVDVITGVIKANLPTRISFHVTSKIDSRTILGEQGAEQLLGKGDMLYMSGGKHLTRIHGPFVSDDEVRRVADYWRGQGKPDYIQAVTEEPADGGFALDGLKAGNPEDEQYNKACQIVFESQKASTSWIQRQMRIGYNSAARLIDRMEEEGMVSAPNHIGRREVLRDQNGQPI